MKIISSRDNPTFRKLRLLAENARSTKRSGQALIDGPHLVEAYRRHVGLPAMLLASESGMRNAEVRALLEAHQPLQAQILRDSLFKELSGVEHPVGIMALIDTPAPGGCSIEGDCIMLDGVQDAGNVGSILRTAAAVGIRDVSLGPGCAGAWTPRVLRAGQGAHFHLHIRERADLQDAVRGYSGKVIAAVAHDGEPLYAENLTGRVAWIFGSEGRGVAKDLIALAGRRVTIPLASDSESLNVAAAVAVCLFEMRRQRLA